MGIYDRDWHKKERYEQRQAERLKEKRLARAYGFKTGGPSHHWRLFGTKVLNTLILCLAVYGAISLVQHFMR